MRRLIPFILFSLILMALGTIKPAMSAPKPTATPTVAVPTNTPSGPTATPSPSPTGVVCSISDTIKRISVSSNGLEGNLDSGFGPINVSKDGRYVAFSSSASNLVSNDTNGTSDVFLHDRQTCKTIRVSVGASGVQANGDSTSPFISPDAKRIVFISSATNLVSRDRNGFSDAFVATLDLVNLQVTQTIRISVGPNGREANNSSETPSISSEISDGINPPYYRAVFESTASNLIGTDANTSGADIFVYNSLTGQVSIASATSAGGQFSLGANSPYISGNGNFVTFSPNTQPFLWELYRKNLQDGSLVLVSVPISGQQINGMSGWVNQSPLSFDGRFVAFYSSASNLGGLTTPDTNGNLPDVFLRDMALGRTEIISVSPTGGASNDISYPGAVSDDARYVVFESAASNLVNGDTNGLMDIFIRDRQQRQTIRVSVGSGGVQGNADARIPFISGDGRYVTFESNANNFVSGDTNNHWDVFEVGNIFALPPTATSTPTSVPTSTPIACTLTQTNNTSSAGADGSVTTLGVCPASKPMAANPRTPPPGGDLAIMEGEYHFEPTYYPEVLNQPFPSGKATAPGDLNNRENWTAPANIPVELWAHVWRPQTLTKPSYPLVVFISGEHATCGFTTSSSPVRTDPEQTISGADYYTYYHDCPMPSGDQTWTVVPTHKGYEYLAIELAKKGYVVVSINANLGISFRDVADTPEHDPMRRVESWRATFDEALFQQSPSEPCLILSYHTALQYFFAFNGSRHTVVNITMAAKANNQRFTLHGYHTCYPTWFFFTACPALL